MYIFLRFKLKKLIVVVSAISVFLAGCAPRPENVEASYVPTSTYSNRSCREIVSERNDIVRQVEATSAQQKKKADNDAVATGVALVLFWPAAFFIGAKGDKSAKLAGLKGHYNALTTVGVQKKCFSASG